MRSPDSTLAQPVPGGFIFETDFRPGREGNWLRSAGTPLGDPATRRLVGPLTLHPIDFLPTGSHLLCVDESGVPYKLAIPSLAREPLPGTFNGLTLQLSGPTPQSNGRVTRDGREFVYLEPSVTSRLHLIENVK